MKKIVLVLAVFMFAACGKGFKTQPDPYLQKTVEIEEKIQNENKSQEEVTGAKDYARKVESGEVVREEKWTKEIPKKYDDVGDFYRVKEIPGLTDNEVLDSVEGSTTGKKEQGAIIKLVRGALKLSQVKHQFSKDMTELEVSGDVTFKGQAPIAFVLKGKATDSEIALEIVDPKSPIKSLFKAKAVCLKDVMVVGAQDIEDSKEGCDKLTIDFYYKHQNTFYTDQLISKAFILSEIKTPYSEVLSPDEYYQAIPDDKLTDYEKKQKKGSAERYDDDEDIEEIKNKELPSYFTSPTIDDVSVLYPEVKKAVEENRQKTMKPKKKLKALPVLKGEEVIPEESLDTLLQPPPAMEDAPDKPGTTKPVIPQPGKNLPQKDEKGSGKPPVTPVPPKKEDPKKPTVPVTPAVPAKPPAKPPKVEAHPPVIESSTASRPLDQAWGKPHTGQVVNGKRVYLTNSTSLLEVFQKLGPDNGFSVWRPQKLRHYGTYDIVEMIVNIGEWIKENVPGFDMKVNDISSKNGGLIGHSSHKTGMDVDLAYITKSPKMTFMDLDRVKGSFTHADFDGANQWKLIKATFDMSPVEVIYVNRKIKNEMCRQALIAGDLKSNTDTKSEAASLLTRLVVIDSNHGDHWHVRMDCNYLRNTLKVQRKCVPHPQQFVGPECQKISIK